VPTAPVNRKASTLLDGFATLPNGATVVEIGCARFAHEIPSDGWSTVHLARAAVRYDWTLHSVDIDLNAVQIARYATEGLPVTIHHADGAAWLAAFDSPIDGLYLDGSADPQEALTQYLAATLAARAVVAIDDVQLLAGHEYGKGDLLLDRLRADGFDVVLHDTEPRLVGPCYRMAVASRG
jgi:hypothetical protein